LYTSNGSKAIVKAKFSENLLVCSYSNLSAVADQIIKLGKDFEILCAGKANSFSMEDSICAGRLIKEIIARNGNIDITDTAKAAMSLDKSLGTDILKMLKDCEHGKLLIENGFEEDLKYTAMVDTSSVIPYLITNVLKPLPADDDSVNKPDS
jgi:2-phosphosulfolactate phosphatase